MLLCLYKKKYKVRSASIVSINPAWSLVSLVVNTGQLAYMCIPLVLQWKNPVLSQQRIDMLQDAHNLENRGALRKLTKGETYPSKVLSPAQVDWLFVSW